MNKINLLIDGFSTDKLIAFLRDSIRSLKACDENLDHLFSEGIYDKYQSVTKIAEADIDNDDLIVIASKTSEPLTERTGKKNQYEIAKKILKEEMKDASLFVFYDDKGNFRFSFIKANYLGTRRDFTDFKRYTYFVTPGQTNKTFIKQIGNCNFNSLDEIVQAFSVEPLNKEFYQDIAKSFYHLIGNQNKESKTLLKLPDSPKREVYQEFAVRLIGRTIFCWFLKSKKSKNSIPLVLKSWLSSETVVETDEKQYNYYHHTLEKLFFLVLNKKKEDRKNYILPEDHEKIPFLNGGLFEAQENDFFKVNDKNIYQNFDLNIPNHWFINLFKGLEQYNFTIDENSIYDAEVSIDPEMLGTIFENLLAEIDPDTEKSARKTTGSFYTPREIVDYMVEQSLVQYLKTKTNTENEDKLLELFKEGGKNKFEKDDTNTILKALSDVKILDPACGSGAFPIGALHKIVSALQKLDPDASWWKNRQIENVPNALAQKILKEKLDGESADYVRKLGVLQYSIYGVDIQPIASEISKLRSFLSLVIDETIDDEAENRGILALPSLEFKFVTANTLIGLEKKNIPVIEIDFGQTNPLQDKLKTIRNDYLQAYGEEKTQLKEDFDTIQTKILKQEIAGGGQSKKALDLTSWKPFSNESNAWFDPYWMYGVEKFDIVIGNPPYIKEYTNRNSFDGLRKNKYYQGKMDIWYFFTCKGIDTLKDKGVVCFIAPNNWTTNAGASKMRNKIIEDTQIKILLDFGAYMIFESADIQTMVMLFQKSKQQNEYSFDYRKIDGNEVRFKDVLELIAKKETNLNNIFEPKIIRKHHIDKLITFNPPPIQSVLDKVTQKANFYLDEKNEVAQGIVCPQDTINKKSASILLGYEIGQGVFELNHKEKQNLNLTTEEEKLVKPYCTSNELDKYYGTNKNENWIIYTDSSFKKEESMNELPNLKKHLDQFQDVITSSNKPYGLHRARNEKFFLNEKIIVKRKCPNQPVFTYTDFNCYVSATFYVIQSERINQKYLTAFLNSKLIAFWLKHKGKMQGNNYQIDKEPILSIPIYKISKSAQQPFINLVDQIIALKKENNNSTALEQQIDIMVYKLYELTFKEVLIIDSEFKLSQEEYDNYQV